MQYKEIPMSWIIALFVVGMVVMRCFGIDSWVTATMGSILGYIMGKHIESTRRSRR